MEFVHDKKSNIIFSLHGSRVHEMKFHNKMLKLKVSELFRYVDNEEKSYPGEICFYDCDLDLCSVLIFNKTLGQGYFKGKAISMKEYMEKYSNLEFEILTEGYFGNSTTYMGWIWEEGKEPVSGIMYLWNRGDMVYRIDEQIQELWKQEFNKCKMKKNVKCTVEDIINEMKAIYLHEGEEALYQEDDWHIYETGDSELVLTTVCSITSPPDFDEETGEEIIPEFALEHGMRASILPEIFQDVIINVLEQKRDASNEELLRALNYYMKNDTFLSI